MKKIVLVIILGVVLLGGIMSFGLGNTNDTISADNYLRIHIRANSNEIEDQNVKYLVKDELVKYLTPLLAEVSSKQEAMAIISQNLDEISNIASLVLHQQGYNYNANAKLTSENFPTRCYQDVVLESGEYDSLIVELGSAEGNNWWCVVYPPLCFVASVDDGSQNVVYRSKILEIIKNFFGG